MDVLNQELNTVHIRKVKSYEPPAAHKLLVKLTMSIDAPGTIRNCGAVYFIGEKLINQLASYF